MHKTRRLHATMLGLGTMLAATLGLAANTHAQTQLTEHTAGDGAAGDKYGQSVGLSGDYAVVGAPFDNSGQGAAYVLRRSGGVWGQMAKLTASDGASNRRFGSSVAISGGTIVVGSPLRGTAGAVYVFRLTSPTVWTEMAILTGSAGDHLGDSVAIEGDRLVAGGPDGAHAHLFEYNGIGWLPLAELSSLLLAAPGSTSQFGYSVSISGDSIAVGARNDSAGAAHVFVYDPDDDVWQWQATIRQSLADANANDQFGNAISISGNTLAIGAPGDDNPAGPLGATTNFGATYVFDRSGSSWSQTFKLQGFNGAMDHAEGFSVALQGDRLASGAYTYGGVGDESGAVHMYQFDGSAWVEDFMSPVNDLAFDPGITDFGDHVGTSVAVDNDLMLTGIPGKDLAGSESGSVLFFEFGPPPPPAPTNSDSDGDGLTDALELAIQALNAVNCPTCLPGCPSINNPDSDGDGLTDFQENSFGPGTCTADTDGDGLNDGDEVNNHLTSPVNADTDGDGLNDGDEVNLHGTSPLLDDTDNDGLTDLVETNSSCLHPTNSDSDGDGAQDGFEVGHGWDPCDADTDGDTLSDVDEFYVHGTDPSNDDTDGDNLDDGSEVDAAAGGSCPNPLDNDSDNDGVLDGDEVVGTCGPCDADSDNDGLCTAGEALAGTNANDPDSDDDGLLDGAEVATNCTNPLIADSDGDTRSDGLEANAGTSPCNVDTDGDTLPDNIDPQPLLFTTPAVVAGLALATAGEVVDTPNIEFLGPNSNVRTVRRTLMAAQIALAAAAINNGNYNAARALLMLSLVRVDGISPPPEWMADGPDKDTIRTDLESLLIILDLID